MLKRVRIRRATVAVGAVIAQFVVLSANLHLNNSYAASNNDEARTATKQALAAKALEPWAASPYLELGELAQAEGRYDVARRWLEEAISRSPLDSNLWAVASHLDLLRGRIVAADMEYRRARALWPTNPLLTSTTG